MIDGGQNEGSGGCLEKKEACEQDPLLDRERLDVEGSKQTPGSSDGGAWRMLKP